MVNDPIFKPGQRCGEFIINRLLFRGLSDTYLAAHAKAKTPVYLQCADIRRTGDATPPEAQWSAAIAKLEAMRNPHAPTLLEAGVHEGVIRFTASEHAPGARIFPMFAASGGERSPLSEVLAFGLLVTRGMLVAHAAGLLHGDLSIHRILVTPTDEGVSASVHILGIGSVELFGAPLETARATPLFRAPEQLLGEAIDPRSDIYSLGMLLYTFVAGRPPFFNPDGSPPPDLLELAMREMPASLDALAGCPQLVADLIHVAIEKHPDHRYPDWTHLGVILTKAFHHVRQDAALRGKDEKQKTARERTKGAEAHYIDAHPAQEGVQSGFRLGGLADAITLDDEREPPWGGVEPPSSPPASPPTPTQRSGQTRTDSTSPPPPALASEQASTMPAPPPKPAPPKRDPRLRRALIAVASLVMVSAAAGGIGVLALAPRSIEAREEILRDLLWQAALVNADLLATELLAALDADKEPAPSSDALTVEQRSPPPRAQLERSSNRPGAASSPASGSQAASRRITKDIWMPHDDTPVRPAPTARAPAAAPVK